MKVGEIVEAADYGIKFEIYSKDGDALLSFTSNNPNYLSVDLRYAEVIVFKVISNKTLRLVTNLGAVDEGDN